MTTPAMASTSSVHSAAVANRRKASELSVIAFAGEPIAKTPHGGDHVRRDLLAQTADEDLDRVAVAIEVLVIEMLNELRARHDTAVMVHEVGEQPVLVRGELDGLARERDARRLGVETQGAALDLGAGVA